MNRNKSVTDHEQLFLLDGKPSIKQAFPLALQHVIAMVVGCVTPAIMIGQIAIENGSLRPEDMTLLIQATLIISGLATLLQLISFKHIAGSGLPVIMGVSFAYLASLQAIAGEFDLATLFGAQLAGALACVAVGIFIKQLRFLFPPMVAGSVVFVIGISLYPTAVNYMAGGVGSSDYGRWQNWLVSLVTLTVVIILNHYTKGFWRLSSILMGVLAGYVLAVFMGMVDFTPVAGASWFQLPKPFYFGIKFEASSIITMAILYAINAVQAIGDFTATAEGGLDREPTTRELSGGIVGNGLGSMIGAIFGGLPTATFSQNVGIVSTTKVVSKKVFYMASGIIMAAGLIPKFATLLRTLPACVLGGATISVFSSIAMTGMKLIMKSNMTPRNTAIVGLGVGIGVGVTLAPESLMLFPDWVTLIFGKSAVVLSTLVIVLLNQILPKSEEDLKVAGDAIIE